MIRLHRRAFHAVIVASGALAAGQGEAVPVVVDYDIAATGQSARASSNPANPWRDFGLRAG